MTHAAGGSDGAELERVRDADRAFFAALLASDGGALEELLDPRFVIVDVASGALTGRDDFLAAVAGAAVRFDVIETAGSETLVRDLGSAAVVVGATRMRFTMPDGQQHDTRSRYTHVFAADGTRWRLVSAQGTIIS